MSRRRTERIRKNMPVRPINVSVIVNGGRKVIPWKEYEEKYLKTKEETPQETN